MISKNDINFQVPPDEILEWADADLPPVARINSKGSHMIFLERHRYKSLKELYEPEMKLAGIRIHPHALIRSRSLFYNGILLKKIGDKDYTKIEGLPDSVKIYHIQWSPDETKLALSIMEDHGLALWVIDIYTGKAWRIADVILNSVMTTPFVWQSNSHSLLVLSSTPLADQLDDSESVVPSGPIISEGHRNPSQHRTYQDLLRDRTDEINFINLSTSYLKKVELNGNSNTIFEGMIDGMNVSPDGRYVMISEMVTPFSYHVPYSKFPHQTSVLDMHTNEKISLQKIPVQDQLPKGFMAVHPYKRSFNWRNDQPAVLSFCVALDKGDPSVEVPYRDALFQWTAPFSEEPRQILKTVNRFSYVLWSQSGYAIATDYWYDSRNSKTYLFYPDTSDENGKIIFDRDVQDRYGDPGSFVTEKNSWSREVIGGDNEQAYLAGEGIRADGIYPFIDRYDLVSGDRERLWEAENKDELLSLAEVMDLKQKTLIIRTETSTDFPNYFMMKWNEPERREFLTSFKNPFSGMSDIHKSIIYYKRKDGIELHATLYIPKEGYRVESEKYPLLMWAYPEEYTDPGLAGQVTSSRHEFTYPWYGSPVFWVRRGYAVLDDVSFPIVGASSQDINNTFIEQLEDNASAAIDAVCKNYPVDPARVAIGGHSYGAFMTANLLTWTRLFAAGIARSGAYNRTLTPFGFQGEQQTYWEAPDLYDKMSPFRHADKLETPLLLIHGQMDNNSGTHTIQSQRYFDALKSLGADVRLVLLPRESHHYRSREAILHMLWEQDRWLEKYLK